MTLKEAIKERVLVLDGAMGTMIQRYGLSGNSEELNLTHPETIAEIHREYVCAGARLITANTFSANRISQKEYGLEDKAARMAEAGVCLARAIAYEQNFMLNADAHPENRIYVAGSVGPTSKSLTLASDVADPSKRPYSFDEMAAVYEEQIGAMVDAGADVIQIETCFDALNAKAALYALYKVSEDRKLDEPFPAIVSVSVSDRSGRTLTGQTIEAFYNSVRHYPLLAFGINCSLGAEDMIPIVKEISGYCECPVICYPNAGLPNELGGYDETPEQMADHISRMSGHVNIVGGCCGTGPEHIEAIAEKAACFMKRQIPERSKLLKASGLEALDVDLKTRNFTNVGERNNVAGSRKFARLIASGDYESALRIAADQIENGATIIDINMDDAMLDSTAEMEKFVRWIQNDPAVAKAALMIDSSHWETILAGLKNAQGKCIVNSISLKDGEEKFMEKAREIHRLGAAVVVMAFDEEGQATDYASKISICERAYNLLINNGMEPQDVIFDANILSVGTGIAEHSRYAIDYIEAVRWIKTNLKGARTSGGVSNLSFAFRGNNTVREAMHSVFLYHAIEAGLDMAIMNPGMVQVYDEIEPELRKCVEDVIFDTDEGATERLVAKAQKIMEAGSGEIASRQIEEIRTGTPEERLSESLVKGRTSELKEDVLASLENLGSAVKVIEGPLMAGMEKVGELFGAGKMFLPQVVKSAKVMRDAVSLLEPYMGTAQEEESAAGKPQVRPVIVNATVKGDVHDIGKNITGIVLSCNGFNVVDLGVMVDKETIIEAALTHKAAIIGASGLITPSLFQMEELCRELSARGMDIPLFIGGATTSALHTAVRLAPLYGHVYHSPDASASAVMAKRYMMDPEKFEEEEHAKQLRIRELHENRASAAASRSIFAPADFLKEYPFDTRPTFNVPVDELEEYFDWRMFLALWGVKYGDDIPDDPEIRKTVSDGEAVLERFKTEAEVLVSVRFSDAYSADDEIVLYDGTRFPMLRQGTSLCDFFPSVDMGFMSPFGMFAISVRKAGHVEGCGCESCRNEYEGMMERAVKVTLAEAASAWLDAQLYEELSSCMGDGHGFKIIKPAAGYAACPDHTLKRDILGFLLDSEKLGITLTESCAMIPDASVCGFIIAHAKAFYPSVQKVGREQFDRYASRRGFDSETARRFLGHLL